MMKKCFTLLLAAVMMAVMSSCRPSVDDVASKIVENQELTSAEYEVIIDYMLDAMNELSDSTEVYKDSPTQLLQSMMRMSQEYEYNNIVLGKLLEVDTTKLEKPVLAKYKKAMSDLLDKEVSHTFFTLSPEDLDMVKDSDILISPEAMSVFIAYMTDDEEVKKSFRTVVNIVPPKEEEVTKEVTKEAEAPKATEEVKAETEQPTPTKKTTSKKPRSPRKKKILEPVQEEK